MRIDSLSLKNWRNYSRLQLGFDRNLNIIAGANGQGKTNLLEAISYLANGRSFRTRNEDELVRFGEINLSAAATVKNRRGEYKVSISFSAPSRSKEISVNGVAVARSVFLGNFNTVLFTPGDLLMVKGPPQLRRRFVDEEIIKLFPVYEQQLGMYHQVLRQRNFLLKNIRFNKDKWSELSGWDEQLARLGASIMVRRRATIHRLGLLARLAHRRLSGGTEELDLGYLSSLPVREDAGEEETGNAMLLALRKSKEEELRLGQTLVGPHRDDLALRINGKEARIFASQGQLRTLVLALKLAELELLRAETGEYPVLLFDDVFSELDGRRRQMLLLALEGKVQTFVSGTEPEKIGRYNGTCSFFTVEGGEVIPTEPAV